jgi:hypothetical protein
VVRALGLSASLGDDGIGSGSWTGSWSVLAGVPTAWQGRTTGHTRVRGVIGRLSKARQLTATNTWASRILATIAAGYTKA